MSDEPEMYDWRVSPHNGLDDTTLVEAKFRWKTGEVLIVVYMASPELLECEGGIMVLRREMCDLAKNKYVALQRKNRRKARKVAQA